MLDVYARRAARPGHRFHWSESDYRSFEAGFPFELTEDQAQTIEDVLADLASDQPMDRVVCGDVGFGKTEVAIRAAFKAIQDGKQVAVLAPTTLLATQHGNTFADRFAGFPIRVETLSRFLTTGQAKQVIEGVKTGEVDYMMTSLPYDRWDEAAALPDRAARWRVICLVDGPAPHGSAWFDDLDVAPAGDPGTKLRTGGP